MYTKKGLPREDEFVICTVKNITPHSVFVELDEYKAEGMIHVSEIQRRWTRNLRAYIKQDSKQVCKVLDLDPKDNHVNLSLRRVGPSQGRTKQAEWKDEKTADDLIKVFAETSKLKYDNIFKEVGEVLLEKYGGIYQTFLESVKQGVSVLTDAGIKKDLATKLHSWLEKRIQIPKSEILGTIIMQVPAADGISIIKKIVEDQQKLAEKEEIEYYIKYVGAPNYAIKIRSEDPKEAEKFLDSIIEISKKVLSKNKGSIEFKRSKK